MARFARYAHVPPGEFGRLSPARTRSLDKHVTALLNDEWVGYFELAKLIALAGVR